MTNEILCSTVAVAADFEVAKLTVALEPQSDLAALARRYRSSRSATVVQAVQALVHLGLPGPDRRGIALGSATGAGPDIDVFLEETIRRGDHLVNPALFPMTVHNAAAGNAAMAAQCRGPNVVVSAGAESVWSAFAAALALIRDDSADVVFVGGFESERQADGTTGTIAALIAISADPAMLNGNHLAPPVTHEAGSSGDPVAELAEFANMFSTEAVAR